MTEYLDKESRDLLDNYADVVSESAMNMMNDRIKNLAETLGVKEGGLKLELIAEGNNQPSFIIVDDFNIHVAEATMRKRDTFFTSREDHCMASIAARQEKEAAMKNPEAYGFENEEAAQNDFAFDETVFNEDATVVNTAIEEQEKEFNEAIKEQKTVATIEGCYDPKIEADTRKVAEPIIKQTKEAANSKHEATYEELVNRVAELEKRVNEYESKSVQKNTNNKVKVASGMGSISKINNVIKDATAKLKAGSKGLYYSQVAKVSCIGAAYHKIAYNKEMAMAKHLEKQMQTYKNHLVRKNVIKNSIKNVFKVAFDRNIDGRNYATSTKLTPEQEKLLKPFKDEIAYHKGVANIHVQNYRDCLDMSDLKSATKDMKKVGLDVKKYEKMINDAKEKSKELKKNPVAKTASKTAEASRDDRQVR